MQESPFGRSLDGLWHLVLPAAVLGVGSAAALARFVRAGLIETLDLDFVRAARARGVSERGVLWRHALRSSLIPVINQVGLSLPVLVSGSLVVEVVFAWPGMGRLTYDALRAYDLPVVLAATMLSTVLGKDFTADTRKAWTELYQLIAVTMLRGAGRVTS